MRIFIESVLTNLVPTASESLFGNAYNPEQNEILVMDDDSSGAAAAVTTGAIPIPGAGPVVDVPS